MPRTCPRRSRPSPRYTCTRTHTHIIYIYTHSHTHSGNVRGCQKRVRARDRSWRIGSTTTTLSSVTWESPTGTYGTHLRHIRNTLDFLRLSSVTWESPTGMYVCVYTHTEREIHVCNAHTHTHTHTHTGVLASTGWRRSSTHTTLARIRGLSDPTDVSHDMRFPTPNTRIWRTPCTRIWRTPYPRLRRIGSDMRFPLP